MGDGHDDLIWARIAAAPIAFSSSPFERSPTSPHIHGTFFAGVRTGPRSPTLPGCAAAQAAGFGVAKLLDGGVLAEGTPDINYTYPPLLDELSGKRPISVGGAHANFYPFSREARTCL